MIVRLPSSKFVTFAPPTFFISSFCFATDAQTPNYILRITDVPPRHKRAAMPSTISYPVRKRYTLQWLINADPAELNMIPNNMDAAFMTGSRKPKPSDLILHYNCGAAAVRQWGHGLEFFKNRANPPRPSTPVPAPMGASKTVHDRTSAIGKRGKPCVLVEFARENHRWKIGGTGIMG